MADTTLAAELMDRQYRWQRHVYAFTRKFYLLGRDRLIDRLKPEAANNVLEIGCGTGRNLIVAARKYPRANFFGVDVSCNMLATAGKAAERAGLSSRLRLAHADATAFEPRALFGHEKFDRVFISYSLSMIPAWRAVLQYSIALLAPGGELHVVDFGDRCGQPRWFGAALHRWLAAFHVTPRADLELQLTTLADHEGAELIFERPYRGYAQYAVLRFAGAAQK